MIKRPNNIADAAEQFAAARAVYSKRSFADIDARYKAARQTRFSKQINGSTSGESSDHDYASEYDYFRMVALGRQFDRDDLYAGSIVSRLVDNVVQCGFKYDPKTGNSDADMLLKAVVNAHFETPRLVEVSESHDMTALARMLFRDSIVSGDVFAVKTSGLKLQVKESHLCRTPIGLSSNVRKLTIHGVELDSLRRRKAYYFAKDDIDPMSSIRLDETQRVEAYTPAGYSNVLHIFHPKRTTQTRGVTKFANISDCVPMHGDIQFAKMVQQQQVSVWSMIRQREVDFELPDNVKEPYQWTEDPCQPGQVRAIQNLSPGMWFTGYPGEKLMGFSPNVPNPTFFDHAKQIQQLIGINLDIPLVMALLDASETNFSGYRGALEQAKLSYVRLQEWFRDVFYRPVLLWLLRQWSNPRSKYANPVLVMLRESGVNIFAHEWVLPTWPYIQPVEDATADVIKLRSGMTSPRRAHASRSQDYDTVMQEIVEDRKAIIIAAKTAAQEINAMFPDDKEPAHWRDLAPMPTSEGETLALPSVEPERMKQDKQGAPSNGKPKQ